MAKPDITKFAVHKDWRLIDLQTKQTLYYGQRVVTFDGKLGVLGWATPPASAGSAGRVYVLQHGASYQSEWFPTVIGAAWVNGEDVP